jgi:hypothetical protein
MAGGIANLLLRIISQKGDAADDVEELTTALEALDHTSATATAEVDTDQGAFDQLVLELEAFDHQRATAHATVETDTSQLDLFTRELENIGSRAFTGKFFKGGAAGAFTSLFPHGQQLALDLDTTKAEIQAAAFHKQLELEFARPIEANIDVDKAGRTSQAISSLVSAFASLGEAGAGFGDKFSSLGDDFQKVTVNLGMFGVRLGPVVAGVLALAIAIGVSLVAALSALVASAALATAALAALGVAFIAALGPMAAVALPAALAFGKVLKVLQQRQTENANAAQKQAQADAQARQFAQQREDAERNLTQAIQNAADARKQAYREMQDAIERVKDAQLGLERAQLSKEQAGLNIEKANLALKKFRQEVGLTGKQFDVMFKQFSDVTFDPTKLNKALGKIKAPGLEDPSKQLQLKQLILDVKDARLNEKEATDHVHDSQVELNRAYEDQLPFLQKGIGGSKNYAAALQGVYDAQRNLNRLKADRQFQLQQDALTKSKSAVASLTADQKKLLTATEKFISIFKQVFGPAQVALIAGIASAMGSIADAMKPLKPAFTALGRAMGGAIADFGKFIASPGMSKLFTALIQGSTKLAPLIGKVFEPLLSLVLKLATSAMRFLIDAFRALAGWLGRLDKKTTVKKLSDLLKKAMPYLQAWLDFAKVFIPAFTNFLIAVAPSGLVFLKWITGIAKKFGDWVKSKKGRKDIKDFFDKAIPLAEAFFQAIWPIIKIIFALTIFMGKLAAAVIIVKNKFDDLNKFLTDKLGWLWDPGKFQDKVGDWAKVTFQIGNDIVQGLIDGITAAATAIWDAITGIANDIIKGFKTVLGIQSPSTVMIDIGKDIVRGLIEGIASLVGMVGRAITDRFRSILSWLGDRVTDFYNAGKDLANAIYNGLKSLGGTVGRAITDRVRAIVAWLGDRVTDFYNLGKSIIQGLIDGMGSLSKSVFNKIKDTLTAPVDWVKKKLGIGSPSKVTFKLGVDIGRGFQQGIESSALKIQTASRMMTPAVATRGAGRAGGGFVIQNQTVNLPAAPGHDQMGDPRHQAAQFAAELRRRGRR